MLKEQLTSKVAEIILRRVRMEKGRLTMVSDLSRINRKEFNIKGLSKMKMHRLLRIIYALALVLNEDEYRKMMNEMRDVIWEDMEYYDFLLLDEK